MDADFLKMLQLTMIQLPDRVDDHKGEKVINEMELRRTLPQRNPFSECAGLNMMRVSQNVLNSSTVRV